MATEQLYKATAATAPLPTGYSLKGLQWSLMLTTPATKRRGNPRDKGNQMYGCFSPNILTPPSRALGIVLATPAQVCQKVLRKETNRNTQPQAGGDPANGHVGALTYFLYLILIL